MTRPVALGCAALTRPVVFSVHALVVKKVCGDGSRRKFCMQEVCHAAQLRLTSFFPIGARRSSAPKARQRHEVRLTAKQRVLMTAFAEKAA